MLMLGLGACNLLVEIFPKKPGENPRPKPDDSVQTRCTRTGKLVSLCDKTIWHDPKGDLWIVDSETGNYLKPVSMDRNIVLPAVVFGEGTIINYDAERIEAVRCATRANARPIEGFAVHLKCVGLVQIVNPADPNDSTRNSRPQRYTTKARMTAVCGSGLWGNLWLESPEYQEKFQPLVAGSSLARINLSAGDEVIVEFEMAGESKCDNGRKARAVKVLGIRKM